MKFLPLTILILFLFSFSTYATDIPPELKKIGFNNSDLIGYDRKGDIEYFIFSNDIIEQFGSVITFVIIDGDIVDCFEGSKKIICRGYLRR